MSASDFKNGFKIASLLGMDSTDPDEVIEFLRSVPAERLVELEGRLLPEKVSVVSTGKFSCALNLKIKTLGPRELETRVRTHLRCALHE